MKENKHLLKTIAISGMGVVISYLITLILTAYITDEIGIEAYGFVSIAKSFTSYASIITVALTTFIVRFISVEYHKGDYGEAKGYYSSSVVACYVVMGMIYLVVLFVILFLDKLIVIPVDLIPSVRLLFVWIFLQFGVLTITTPYSAASYIKNRLDIVGIAKIFSYVVEVAVLILMFKAFSPSVWFVGVGSFSASFALLLYNYYLTRKLTPELRFSKTVVKIKYIKDILSRGLWTSLNSLGNVLNSGLDLIISNRMLTAIQTGQISVIKSFDAIFSILYVTVFQPFQPKLIEAYASGDMKRYMKETQKAMSICGFFSNLAFAGFLSLGRLYFKLWLPNQDFDFLYILAVWSVAGSITAGVSHPVYYVNTLTLKNKIPCWVTIGGGFLNVAAMYFMLKYTSIGPIAVVATTSVIMMGINLFFNPIYSAKCIGVSVKEFYVVIVRHLVSVVIMSIVCYFIAAIFSPVSWLGLVGTAIPMCLVCGVIHAIVMLGWNSTIKKVSSIVRR